MLILLMLQLVIYELLGTIRTLVRRPLNLEFCVDLLMMIVRLLIVKDKCIVKLVNVGHRLSLKIRGSRALLKWCNEFLFELLNLVDYLSCLLLILIIEIVVIIVAFVLYIGQDMTSFGYLAEC
jgi:hypothetical protein